MCDTVVVTGRATRDGGVLFAKNSDREPAEAQAIEHHPAASHLPGAMVRCTYVQLPQVQRTKAVALSRPVWMWGAEMGANEDGVAVGNEAVFTRAPLARRGLLGMDLVRLTLERAGSAEAGVAVLTELLDEHGQGGACGYRNKRFSYHNSFLLADRDSAWVVETAGRAWVAARVSGVRAISNGLTLRERYDRASAHLAAYARDLGLHRGKGAVDFARCFSARGLTLAANAARRRRCVEASLRGAREISPLSLMAALRQHGSSRDPGGGLRQSVCGHASWLPTRAAGQTTSSWVAQLGPSRCTHFVTGSSAACTSVFKPLWVDAPPSGVWGPAVDRYHPSSVWWRHERLHRRALPRLRSFLTVFGPQRDGLERRFVTRAREIASAQAGGALTAACLDEVERLEREWLQRLAELPPPALSWRQHHWRQLSARDGVPLSG